MSTKSVKYRPYFLAPQLNELLRCLKKESTDIELIRYLEAFNAKVSFDAVSKVVSTPRKTIEDKLGLVDAPRLSITVDKEHCYNLWLLSPEKLTILELEYAHLYRYENDLMSPEEEALFEETH